MLNKILLLVEDDPRDAALTLRALEKYSFLFHLVFARDGLEALDYLFATGPFLGRDTSLMPHIILLDLNLPKLDGLQLLQLIRSDARTRRLPVVVFSSSSEDQDMINSYDLGANSYLRKPVDFEQFLEAIRQLGSYWLLLNQVASVE